MRTRTCSVVSRWHEVTGWLVLTLMLLVGVPLFLRMPVWCDVTHYDLCARNVLQGGVHYRDTFDTNLPGMVWLHVAIRSLLGWRSEAIRFADLVIVSGIVALLAGWLSGVGLSRHHRLWAGCVLLGFYLSTSEFSHCQRDTWMLLPAILAVLLASRQWAHLAGGQASVARIGGFALSEGLCWGCAVWIKPVVALPASMCLLMLTTLALHPPARRLVAVHVVGLVAGGLLAGFAGVAWMVVSGTWPYFWWTLVTWSWEYAQQRRGPRAWLLREFKVWLALHPVAIGIALANARRALVSARSRDAHPRALAAGPPALLSAVYLGWLYQIEFLQRSYVYHHVPAILLAIAVIFSRRSPWKHSLLWHVAVTAFALLAIVVHPVLRPQRLRLWWRCVREPATAAMWNRLALWPEFTDWEDLDSLASYLRSQGLKNRELTCFATFTTPLYLQLGLRPSTRFTQLHAVAYYLFPNRRAEVLHEVTSCPHRFIVTDVGPGLLPSMTVDEALAVQPGKPLALPPAFPAALAEEYPWTEPIVFRAGRYFVHRATNPPSRSQPFGVGTYSYRGRDRPDGESSRQRIVTQ